MPVWLLIACMILANYRASRLVSKDDFPPLLWLRDRLSGGWRPLTSQEAEEYPLPVMGADTHARHPVLGGLTLIDGRTHRYLTRARWSPYWLGELVSCPWCISGWLSGALTAGVAATVGVPAPWLVWGAVWGASALIASREWA